MKVRWDRFGSKLGIGFCFGGFILLFLGWNGAASVDRVPSQFPYLISGGLAGLSLIVIGVGVMLVQGQREERARLQASIVDLQASLEKLRTTTSRGRSSSTRGMVVAGTTSYHRPDCRLAKGRDVEELSPSDAKERGLSPCRVCKP